MQVNDVIVVTGAAGFIGSYLTGFLNSQGYNNLILVDDFGKEEKLHNLEHKKYLHKIHREDFFDWEEAHPGYVKCIFHLGARTDTTEMNYAVHKKWNLDYSIRVWELCVRYKIPLVYASSAATYGGGEHGYKDDHQIPGDLHPLNPYGVSKNEFDIWALEQKHRPPFWAGLKFFNVYGPNEYHKGRMGSVVMHAFNQISKTGEAKLFRSHNPHYKDGEQIRDFIYVKDVVQICTWLMQTKPASGLYNTGTGTARTFKDLVKAIFSTLNLPENIQYIDTPIDIRDKYQYFTEADMNKLLASGYPHTFYTLEEGVKEYVSEYLSSGRYY
ncbi:ADP-glyceromanno-heptose 6-epimerase [Flavipsychrobacter stenotrophus]|uniref:ADP-L-glycero-D-manno-heptose-6-epimerase n=1 Tax=Flavipsychrobacter stenotrophus TaxID=2077091 RepID=A0A2S7SY54_9BACT|nr:ADP-glyceromanno-heptose 6-epimerase [Flavipsychrobacter stenotrophus]PQJ11561.1 ADP-glyceromanno-heptose 6-epimerase [Flavipsychrobacter stenotrophus]